MLYGSIFEKVRTQNSNFRKRIEEKLRHKREKTLDGSVITLQNKNNLIVIRYFTTKKKNIFSCKS